MGVYSKGTLAGVVGYKQLYPGKAMPALDALLTGLPRIWAIRLCSNIQNKLVGKPFYNPNFRDEKTTQIDVPRFFLGPKNLELLLDVIQRYKSYHASEEERLERPMEYATGCETPLLLLKYVMAMPESDEKEDIAKLEKKLLEAFLIANEVTFNRKQGEPPYEKEDNLELYIACLLMSRYAYQDFFNDKSELDELVRNQCSRTVKFFRFVANHAQLKDLLDDFLDKYNLPSWNEYVKTYFSIQALARDKTGVINFEKLQDVDGLLSEEIVNKDSIDIHEDIPLTENIDYEAFRKRPFIKIAPHEYAVIDVSFMIKRMFDGLYFDFNALWQCKHEYDLQGFNRIYTTEFSEETVLVNCLKEVANSFGWLSLTDKECKVLIPEKKLSSPPDFYIRDGKDAILFECKDVRIPKEIKADGTTKRLIEEVDKDFVGYLDTEKDKWRYKGVGQLVRNAKRIQDGLFKWDENVDKDSRIYLVLVLADTRHVDGGWKNYLNRKMFEECVRQKVDYRRVCPLVLTDLGTLITYKNIFKKYGLLHYFVQYFQKTAFDPRTLFKGDYTTNVMNQTMSFSTFMKGERLIGGEELSKEVLSTVVKHPKQLGHHSYVTKTVEYADLFDDDVKDAENYLSGINKRWLIEGVVHMISVDSFESFSMDAERGLLVMFQDYKEKSETKQLFRRLKRIEDAYPGTWHTLINHQALFRLLRKVLMLPNERQGKGESSEAYVSLLKAILAENTKEMAREKEMLSKIGGEADIRDAMIVMQQDVLNIDQFGENKKEIEKSQMLKYLALCEFGKEHREVGEAIKRVIGKHGFESAYSYMLLAQMPLSVYHDKEKFGEGLFCLRRVDFEQLGALRLWEEFVSYVSDKHIDVWDTEKMKTIFTEQELLDNTCFRKYPVLKMSEEEYVITSQPYYSHLFYDGFWWSVKEELKALYSDKAIMNLLTKEFSEKKLFYNLAVQMVGNKRIRIYNEYCFDDRQPSPDIAIRTRHHLFMFEYKDMRVLRDVADGNDMNLLMDFMDDRLNKEKGSKGGNKGLPQLVSDMEEFFTGKRPWGDDFKKGNVKIHPILVVNSRLFTVRGINYILQQKLHQRILESEILKEHTKEIGDLLVMDYDMLILVVSKAYKNFAVFHHLLYSYQTHLRKIPNPVERFDSFKHYVMNKWEGEKTECEMKHFKNGYKHVVKSLVRTKESISCTMNKREKS